MIATRIASAIAMAALALSFARPAAAQNPAMPAPSGTPPVLMPPASGGNGGGSGGGNHGGMGSGNGGGWGHHRPRPIYPPFVYWPYSTFYPGMATDNVQPQPVNPEPFKPTTPPTFGQEKPAKPYAPPSVEIAPGGIEIIRGPS